MKIEKSGEVVVWWRARATAKNLPAFQDLSGNLSLIVSHHNPRLGFICFWKFGSFRLFQKIIKSITTFNFQ